MGRSSRYREDRPNARGKHERLTRVVDWNDQSSGGPHRPPPGHAPIGAHPLRRSPRPRSASRRRIPNLKQPGMVLSGFVERVGDPVPLVAADGSSHQRRSGARRGPRRDGAHGRRRRPDRDRRARALGAGDRRRAGRGAARHAEPGPERGARRALSRIPSRRSRRCRPRRDCRRTALWCCAISAAAEPASHWPTRGRTSRPSARQSATPSSPATRSTRRCSTTSSRASPKPTTPTRRAPRRSARWPGCATSAGWPRSGCPPRPQRSCAPSYPGFTSDVRVTRTELEQLIAEPLAACSTQSKKRCSATIFRCRAIVRRRDRRRWGEHPVGHPAAVDPAAGARRHHAAVAAQRGGRSCTGRRHAPTRQRGWPRRADAPTGMAAAGWAAGAAGLAAGRIGVRRRGLGDLPCAGVVAGRCAGRRAGAVRRRGLHLRAERRPPRARRWISPTRKRATSPSPSRCLPWYRRPTMLFGAAAAAALLAIGGLAITLTSTSGNTGPVTETATTVETGPSPGQPADFTSSRRPSPSPGRTANRARQWYRHRRRRETTTSTHDNDHHHHNHHDHDDHARPRRPRRRPPPRQQPRPPTSKPPTTTQRSHDHDGRGAGAERAVTHGETGAGITRADIPPAARDVVATLIAAPTDPVKRLVSGSIGTGKSSVLAADPFRVARRRGSRADKAAASGRRSRARRWSSTTRTCSTTPNSPALTDRVADPASTVVIAGEPLAHRPSLRALATAIERENPFVSLGALAPPEVARIAGEILGAAPTPEIMRSVMVATAGLPFLVRPAIAAAPAVATRSAHRPSIAEAAKFALIERLRRLDEPVLDALAGARR